MTVRGARSPRPGEAAPAVALAVAAALLAAPPLAAQSEPERPRSSSWSPWVARGVGFAMLVASDVGLRTTVQDLRDGSGPLLGGEASVGGRIADFGNTLGDWETSLPWLAAGSVAVGAVADGMRGAGRGLAILGGVAAGTMANEGINQLVGRSRPVWGEGAFTFDPLSGHASFPSGHTSLAFSVAGGVDAVTDGWLPATAAYTVAGTAAFARLYDDKHWLSDVVVGAVLSATVSRMATHRAMELLGVARDGGSGAAEGSPAADGSRPLRARLLFTPSFLGVQLSF